MKKVCPIIQKECLEHGCEFFVHTLGINPQTGKEVDEWGCAISYLPLLLIENAYRTRQVSAALDRNNNTLFSALPESAQQRVMTSNPNLLNGTKHVQ